MSNSEDDTIIRNEMLKLVGPEAIEKFGLNPLVQLIAKHPDNFADDIVMQERALNKLAHERTLLSGHTEPASLANWEYNSLSIIEPIHAYNGSEKTAWRSQVNPRERQMLDLELMDAWHKIQQQRLSMSPANATPAAQHQAVQCPAPQASHPQPQTPKPAPAPVATARPAGLPVTVQMPEKPAVDIKCIGECKDITVQIIGTNKVTNGIGTEVIPH